MEGHTLAGDLAPLKNIASRKRHSDYAYFPLKSSDIKSSILKARIKKLDI